MNFYISVLAFVVVFVNSSQESLINEENCGVSAISKSGVVGRIVNGTASVQGQWPWYAAIAVTSRGSQTIVCGGTLINTSWVVTAAHCMTGVAISDITVYLGMNDKLNASGSNLQVHSIRNYTCHEAYVGESNSFKDDICILHTTNNVSYTSFVQPICLPASSTSTSVGETCTVVGFGETQGTAEQDNILQFAEVQIIDHTLCSEWYRESGITVPNDHTCAGYEGGGTDTCQGDSGGPLACQETVSGGNAYVLRGITSFGVGCALAQRPGVYTTIERYLHWIELNTIGFTSITLANETPATVTTLATTASITSSGELPSSNAYIVTFLFSLRSILGKYQ